ncbi:PTS sugar transporter subunit IIA [Kandleria vitulina]|uniref:PTS sugar transporter subunit IIA n=1 Tax=Kandleria vitulina TaxID=1630 RepID=UPI0033291644
MNNMLNEQTIFLDVDEVDKDSILKFICKKAKALAVTDDEDVLYQDFLDREEEFSTGLQDGFAIPHARTKNVKKATVMFLRNKRDIDWVTMDDQPVKYIFALLVPEESAGNLHLKMISSLATALLEDDFKETVKSSEDKTELMNYILKNMEEEN